MLGHVDHDGQPIDLKHVDTLKAAKGVTPFVRTEPPHTTEPP